MISASLRRTIAPQRVTSSLTRFSVLVPSKNAGTKIRLHLKPAYSKPNMTIRHLSEDLTSIGGSVVNRPPLLVRASLVGASVGLATPVFAFGAIARTWFSIIPKTAQGRFAKRLASVIFGVGSTGFLLKFAYPFLRDNSEFVLPFALSNAVASMSWYTAFELWLGLDVMLSGIPATAIPAGLLTAIAKYLSPNMSRLLVKALGMTPVGGAVVGALTALTAPFYWPFFCGLCWDKEFQDIPQWFLDSYSNIAVPVGVPVGILAGISLQTILKPFLVGFPNAPWTQRTLPAIAACAGLSAIYFNYCKSDSSAWYWEKRMNHATGHMASFNIKTGEYVDDFGEMAEKAQTKRSLILGFRELRSIFDVHSWFREGAPSPRTKVVPVLPEGVSISDFERRKVLYSLVDVLIRLKFLQLEKAKQQQLRASAHRLTKPTPEELALLQRNFVVEIEEIVREFNENGFFRTKSDILELLKLVEKALLLRQRGIYSESNDKEYAAILRKIMDMSESSKKHGEAIALLPHNLDIVKEEFKAKLNYEVKENVVSATNPKSWFF